MVQKDRLWIVGVLVVGMMAAMVAVLFGSAPIAAAPFGNHSTLNTSLISYWSLDENVGNRADSVGTGCGGSGCTLTDNGVQTATAKLGVYAAYFPTSTTSIISRTDHADLSANGTDFSIAYWVYFDVLTTTDQQIARKDANPQREWHTFYYGGGKKIALRLQNGATNTLSLISSPQITQATWYFVAITYSYSSRIAGISINNGAVITGLATGDIAASSAIFQIGMASQPGGKRLDEFGWWKKTLSAAEVALLYNSGAGCAYPFTACEGTHTPAPSLTPTPTETPPYPTYTPLATNTPYPTYTPFPTATPTATPPGVVLTSGNYLALPRSVSLGQVLVFAVLIVRAVLVALRHTYALSRKESR